MITIGKITKPGKPKTSESLKVAYIYAALILILAVCQLFTFDKFIPLIESFGLPGGELGSKIIASVIVGSEVFALPFLLGMELWRVLRIKSMIFGWIVPIIWLFITIWINVSGNNVSNVGFLGTIIDLIPGWWAVLFSIALGILSVWASWGLWPIKATKR